MVDRETFSESVDAERDIGFVAARLADGLDRPEMHGEIRPSVEAEFRRFDSARVREFVPVFVERRVRADLRALSRA